MPHEKTEILQTLRDLGNSYRDMKNYVNEIFTKTYKIEQALGTGGQGGAESSQIRNYLDGIQNEVRQIRAQQIQTSNTAPVAKCPEISCASSTYLTIVIVIQSVVILGFIFLRYFFNKKVLLELIKIFLQFFLIEFF